MSMWKIIVAPDEDEHAWDRFLRDGIVAIGWCDRKWENALAVRRFREIKPGDLILAHLPEKRSGKPFLAVGIGRVLSEYHEVVSGEQDCWNGTFRRQFKVEWLSAAEHSIPELFKRCGFRVTVCRLSEDLAEQILRRYGLLISLAQESN